MCGICGIYEISGQGDHRDAIVRMVRSLHHRGPDDSGWMRLKGSGGVQIYLGNTRLSVIDTSSLGHQPMTSHDGEVSIVYNGEIYNFREVRRILQEKGHSFHSGTDTEVLLSAYLEWGIDALEHLNGMFTFALWDGYRNELLLARDRLGIKPLYYSWQNGVLTFASEIKALFPSGFVGNNIDPIGLADFLTYQFTLTPRTIFSQVKKLEPGTYIRMKDGRLSVHSYWTPETPEQTDPPPSMREYEEILITLLRESVRKRLVSDVPLGVFLSGGLDSSIVTGLMAEMTEGRIKTFSMGFPSEGEEPYNELRYARQVASHFDTDHHEHLACPDDIGREIERIAYHFDEPFGGGLHTYFISRLARENVTVVLSGLGGDELFAGYEWNRIAKILKLYGRLPRLLRRGIIDPLLKPVELNYFDGGLLQRAKKLSVYERTDPGLWYPLWLNVFSRDALSELLPVGNCEIPKNYDPAARFKRYLDDVPGRDFQDQLLYLQIKTTMLDDFLNYTDKMSMAHSLECRVPFLDHELVEFAMNIPFEYKMKGLKGKYILRNCARSLLPRDVIDRDKQGFIMPMGVWMRGKLKPLIQDCLLGPGSYSDDLLDRDHVRSITESFYDGNEHLERQVWSLFTFRLWKETFSRTSAHRSETAEVYGETH